MERYKVIFKYKYGRSFKYTDIVRAESKEELKRIGKRHKRERRIR